MAKYTVQFATAEGRIGTEIVEAASERAAAAQLESAGRTPITVRAGARGGRVGPTRLPRVKGGKGLRRAILDFTHQLGVITESGIPIISGLKAVCEQTEHPRLRSAVQRIVGRIEGGRGLAEAMEAEPDVFPVLYVKTLAAGEKAGNVPEVLQALARYMEQESETRAQIRSAMTYPILVVAALVLATVFMLIFVVPQFAAMFERYSGKLPLPTRILMGASDAILVYWYVILAAAAAAVWGMRRLMSRAGPREWLDVHALRAPVLGELLLGVYMTRFIELMALLTRSALPILQSLRVVADSTTNGGLRTDIRGMMRSVEGGRSLAEAFGQTRWVTPLVKRMLAIGEQSGRTDQIFAYVGKYYATQTQRSIKLLSTLVEPVLVTGLAAVVLFFALAMFLPMWKMLKLMGSS